jgi:class 3 adenylate cyclase/tetratricopeptide (TPR) repeat protein
MKVEINSLSNAGDTTDVGLMQPAMPAFGADGERRQLTVMFCDVVGSTKRSVGVDPEIVRSMFRTFEEACAVEIKRYDGFVFQRQGDAIVAYFGYPTAREDNAERAIRAALAIIENVPASCITGGEPLRIRVGIATGLVVVADLRSRDQSAAGDTLNLAARLQTIAEPNTIIVGDVTRRVASGRFQFDNLGRRSLKGFPTPVRSWRVSKPRRSDARFEARAEDGLTPLVGRVHELTFLQGRWETAAQGTGQAVVIVGEPGIGKSRIIHALRQHIGDAAEIVLRFQCSPYFSNTAFHPFIEHLERELAFTEDVPLEARFDRLQTMAAGEYGRPPVDVALIAAMMSLPAPGEDSIATMTAQRRKQATDRALIDLVTAVIGQRRTLMIFEDVHWADPSSLDIVRLFLGHLTNLPALLLITQRPDEHVSIQGVPGVVTFPISRLIGRQARQIALDVAGGSLPETLLNQIVDKTDGVPLYVEEFTKSLIAVGGRDKDGTPIRDGALATAIVPETLRDSLMARLDRLESVKEVVQVGAVLGRTFPDELLRLVAPVAPMDLDLGLRRATDSGLLFRRGVSPAVVYTFKHALIQDVAYDSLLRNDRQSLHARTADVLERRFPSICSQQPELLAHHYTEAGLAAQAAPLWLAAGRLAAARSANLEAVGHLRKALAVLQAVPLTAERNGQEVLTLILLGNALMATQGYGSPEVGKTFDRARAICEPMGATPQLFPVLAGLWMFYLVRGQIRTARSLSNQMQTLGAGLENTALMIEAHRELGMTLYFSGSFSEAREELQCGADVYDPVQHRSHAFQYGTDPGIACLCYGAASTWSLGYPDQALLQVGRALDMAQQCDHLFTRAFAMFFSAMMYQWRGEVALAKQQAELDIALCRQEGFVLWLAIAMIVHGWSVMKLGKPEEGLLEVESGVAAFRATGAGLAQTYILSLLADAHRQLGHYDKGLQVVAEALAVGRKNGERVFEADLHRLHGQLLFERAAGTGPDAGQSLPDDTFHAVQASYRRAVTLARKQKARTFELRAMTGLAHLWAGRGRSQEARDRLQRIYATFTEGHATQDLLDASQLLQTLR